VAYQDLKEQMGIPEDMVIGVQMGKMVRWDYLEIQHQKDLVQKLRDGTLPSTRRPLVILCAPLVLLSCGRVTLCSIFLAIPMPRARTWASLAAV